MAIIKGLPNYVDEFQLSDFRKGLASRSVYSPAAYLADLLQLLDDYFKTTDLDTRRPDLKQILLDGEQTFTLVPYLDIVNELLEAQVPGDAYDTLRESRYPFNLPFSLGQARTQRYLQEFPGSLETTYLRFAEDANATRAAQLSLGLSDEILETVLRDRELLPGDDTTDIHDQLLRDHGLPESASFSTLREVAHYLAATDTSATELRQLLFQQLSSKERKASAPNPAEHFFTNHALGGHVALNPTEDALHWHSTSGEEDDGEIPLAWFDRANRLLRLARHSGIALTDIDLILHSCANHQLNGLALQCVALVARLSKVYDLPIDKICSLFANMNTTGFGDDAKATPEDLFNRIFNGRFAVVEKTYLQADSVVPEIYLELQVLPVPEDLTLDIHAPLARRLGRALDLSPSDFLYLLEILSDRLKKPVSSLELNGLTDDEGVRDSVSASQQGDLLSRLSLYHRFSVLSHMLELSMQELVSLLDVLQGDPWVASQHSFSQLLPLNLDDPHVFQILAAGSSEQRQWLVQLLSAVAKWMQERQYSSGDLQRLLSRPVSDQGELSPAAAQAATQTLNALRQLLSQVASVLLGPGIFSALPFNSRLGRAVLRTLQAAPGVLVSRLDPRVLLPVRRERLETLALEVLDRQRHVDVEDFLELQLHEPVQDKLYLQLLLQGYLTTDGELLDTAIPNDFKEFTLFRAFDNAAVFELIVGLQYERGAKHDAGERYDTEEVVEGGETGESIHTIEEEQGRDDNEDIRLLPGDLFTVANTTNAQQELLDTLRFNGCLDDAGVILDHAWSSDRKSSIARLAEVDLPGAEEKIFALIRLKLLEFENTRLVIDASHFAALGLDPVQVSDLIANLRFNHHLDADDAVIDKRSLLALPIREFDIVLQFYPLRRQILAILQTEIASIKSQLCAITKADLDEIARELVAEAIMRQLNESALEAGAFNDQGIAFFTADENAGIWPLPVWLDDSARQVIFRFVQGLLENSRTHVLDPMAFVELGLDEQDAHALAKVLIDDGILDPLGQFRTGQRQRFLAIDNAYVFSLNGFEDLEKDVFFVLNKLASKVESTVAALVDALTTAEQEQEQALVSAIAEWLEADTEVARVIAMQIAGASGALGDRFLAPLLAVLDAQGKLLGLPAGAMFRSTLRRMSQFAEIASRLSLNATDCAILFRDQSLVQKFPEPLSLPANIDQIAVLMTITVNGAAYPSLKSEIDREVVFLYEAQTGRHWLYEPETYVPLTSAGDLYALSPGFADKAIQAGYNDHDGHAWLIIEGQRYRQVKGESTWMPQASELGKRQSNFDKPDRIDAAYVAADETVYLFANKQYLRSRTGLRRFDDGYPRNLDSNWARDSGLVVPEAYTHGIDAAFRDADDVVHVFRGEQFVHSLESSDGAHEHDSRDSDDAFTTGLDGESVKEQRIADVWGRTDNPFETADSIDAALTLGPTIYLFSANHCLAWSTSTENPRGRADEGSLQTIQLLLPGVPDTFARGIDAAFQGGDGVIRLFRDERVLQLDNERKVLSEAALADTRWGQVKNEFRDNGAVSAAFSGLDGRAYLFCGKQFIRYSNRQYDAVDEGYPLRIADHWGGLTTVDAAFVLDGRTYLVGADKTGQRAYVRYATSDYRVPDDDSPIVAGESWWVEHFNLSDTIFASPDAVFVGPDNVTYLFKSDRYIAYDHLKRWWTQPALISSRWSGLPFDAVSAAFSGKDGRTWLFSGIEFVHYTDPLFHRIDDGRTKRSAEHWGRVRNTIVDSERVDAALVLRHRQDDGVTQEYTYLFADRQYVRYTGGDYSQVDEGYPKTIARALHNEPRFSELGEAHGLDGIDAAWSDRRNIHLLKDGQLTVISSAPDARYELAESMLGKLDDTGDWSEADHITAVFEDAGNVYIASGERWRRLHGLESESGPLLLDTSMPPGLRSLPADFSQAVDAVLTLPDGRRHVFNNRLGRCYNTVLERDYPIGEEWGRINNVIANERRVDAALVGVDGTTWLFRGPQYVRYAPDLNDSKRFPIFEETIFIDGYPGSIKNDWGGLESVASAFTQAGKTWLVEHSNAIGEFRYVCYSTPDLSAPDGPPQSADVSWWDFPAIYRDEGFDAVDSVFVDEEHLYLFHRDQFIQYNHDQDLWTYPRPIDRIWRDLPFGDAPQEEGITVFRGRDERIYLFSGEQSCFYLAGLKSPSALRPINEVWGRIRNVIVDQHRVDAVLVDGPVCYLFSADQYVRYSGEDFHFIDPHYPRQIIGDLRQETSFEHLPASFDTDLQWLLESGGALQGALVGERHRYLFDSTSCQVVSNASSARLDIRRLSALRNTIQESGHIDAAFTDAQGRSYLFAADQYVRYSIVSSGLVDAGYPKSIVDDLASEGFDIALDPRTPRIDAALQLANGELRLYAGNRVYISGTAASGLLLEHAFLSLDAPFPGVVNAAFVAPDGKAYFFSGERFIRYSAHGNEFVDDGYPRLIRDAWGNLPAAFEESIDHAFVFEGMTYLVKHKQYVRFGGSEYRNLDPLYPQAFQRRWGAWNDYLLNDLKLIEDYHDANSHRSPDGKDLSDLLDPAVAYAREPYHHLARLFGWDVQEVKWLKRHNAFLPSRQGAERNFDVEQVLAMIEIHALADGFGVAPRELYESLFVPGIQGKVADVIADTLVRWLGQRFGTSDWELLSDKLHDDLNQVRHDALLPYVIAHDPQVDDSRQLFARQLIDVEMGKEALTSRVKEATAAVQLYLHRFFLNLESLELHGTAKAEARQRLKLWWSWMRNYRLWEANRKVFLYPENYLRPELRDTKTNAFASLEDALLQGEVNESLVTSAFHNYMNEFAAVGNLRIAGANTYHDPTDSGDQMLVLLGRTRTEPGQFHYRTARFTSSPADTSSGDIAVWENWSPVDIAIDSDRVFPVYAFGRIVLVWTEIEAFEESVPFIKTRGGTADARANSTSKVETADTVLSHRATIKYSFYDFNKRWINPQVLKKDIVLEYRIDAILRENDQFFAFSGEYCLETTPENPRGNVKKIKAVFPELPASFHEGIDAALLYRGQRIFFKGDSYYVDGRASRADKAVHVPIPIGHSFRPPQDVPPVQVTLLGFIVWRQYQLPVSDTPGYQLGLSAAFVVEGGESVCLIDTQGLPTFFSPEPDASDNSSDGGLDFRERTYDGLSRVKDGHLQSDDSIFTAFLRILTRDLLRLEPVDAVFEDQSGKIYVLRRGQYECYRYKKNDFLELEKLDGYPKPIRGNLRFNMDKFFDKLHVVRDEEDGLEFVELTYSSPEANNTLLSGRIAADFTFRKSEPAIRALQDQLVTGNLLPSIPSMMSTFRHQQASKKFQSFSDVIEKVRTDWSSPDEVPDFEPLAEFYEHAVVYFDSQGELPEGKQPFSDDLRAILDKLKESGHLSPSGHPVLEEHAQRLAAALHTFDQSLRGTAQTNKFAALREEIKATERILADESLTDEPAPDNLPATELQDLREALTSFDTLASSHLQNYNQRSNQFELLSQQNIFGVLQNSVEVKNFKNKLSKYGLALVAKRSLVGSPLPAGLDAARLIDRETLDLIQAGFEKHDVVFKRLQDTAAAVESDMQRLLSLARTKIETLKERFFGRDDLFPEAFGIRNESNFTFGQPDWHVFEAKVGSYLCRPVSKRPETAQTSADRLTHDYEIIRLSTTPIPDLSRLLFSQGINGFLQLDTQKMPELPEFKPVQNLASSTSREEDTGGRIHYDPSYITGKPHHETLDFASANAVYYWEIFFHSPFLIAQALNRAQKFEDAQRWYDCIFDPTSTNEGARDHWRFLPFNIHGLGKAVPSDLLSDVLVDRIDVTNLGLELEAYLNDPFDPHAIAGIRKSAYQKAIVMRYVDNLLDWADMLFGQYTRESINEARMLYVLAYDLLGKRPESIGDKVLPPARSYSALDNPSKPTLSEPGSTDILLGTKETNAVASDLITDLETVDGQVHRSVASSYFHIPHNDLFLDYWGRVEDRLFKIRNSLNIKGVKQTLPLFQPPIDPMSVVAAVAGGASLASIAGNGALPVPHYRFSFVFYKARELVQRLNQFGGELLSAIEKGDAEQLALMQHKQQGTIMSMLTQVKQAQITEAKENITALQASLRLVEANESYNLSTVDEGFLPFEQAQMSLMGTAVVGHAASAILRVVAGFGGAAPDGLAGPFIAGVKAGGQQAHAALSGAAEVVQTLAEGLSVSGELLGIVAQHERLMADTQHLVAVAEHEKAQIHAQLAGARQQLLVAQYELDIHKKEKEQHASIRTFMSSKFTNEQLYQWLSSQLSGLYYKTYRLAHDMARGAEQAFRFERGVTGDEVSFISGMYWNSQRRGLLAGDALGVDLDAMEVAFLATDERRLEISNRVSLMSHEPMALLRLKAVGVCEFEFSEAFFDYDFQGHFCRQMKTLELVFESDNDQGVNATLIQISNTTLMSPDTNAVKYLLAPGEMPPPSVRSDWRANQQIVLSHTDEYDKANGLFEARLDDERYLPFEGTGAVSRWRLELNGKRGSVNLQALRDVAITLKYTARYGGQAFADAVRGLLKPYDTVRLINLAIDFPQSWQEFQSGDGDTLNLALQREQFPNMSGGRISGIFSAFDTLDDASVSIRLNNDEALLLRDRQFLETSGISIGSRGSSWSLRFQGDKRQLSTVHLVLGYKARV